MIKKYIAVYSPVATLPWSLLVSVFPNASVLKRCSMQYCVGTEGEYTDSPLNQPLGSAGVNADLGLDVKQNYDPYELSLILTD